MSMVNGTLTISDSNFNTDFFNNETITQIILKNVKNLNTTSIGNHGIFELCVNLTSIISNTTITQIGYEINTPININEDKYINYLNQFNLINVSTPVREKYYRGGVHLVDVYFLLLLSWILIY